ncbi:MAG: (S)-ureidoglycine aminohydrolase [Verrucomicrobia bacterium]|nr:MAG: (S)-ureidoglycine aminohydrolase [Verrucomicrobiota bacterium]
MSDLFGFTRDVIQERYALRTPSGFVPSNIPGWRDATVIVQISEGMGARFCQLLVTFQEDGEGAGSTGLLEFFVYLLAGACQANIQGKKHKLESGEYIYLPPGHDFHFERPAVGTQLLIFQKRFEPMVVKASSTPYIVGHEKNVPGKPFLGNEDARLQVLLPDKPEFDMAVNIFTYQPGATLPFVESHIMEHGLLMLKGQGIYRLDSDWHPVQAGDVIWMAPYCPQWFVAMGKTPASYIYYKDVNRAPL